MKGTVFGGVVYWPQHPDADMHGQLRCVIRCATRLHVRVALERHSIPYDDRVWILGIWRESQSAAEKLAIEHDFGVLFTCPLRTAYLSSDNYQAVGRNFGRQVP